jgi:hypothetical protein
MITERDIDLMQVELDAFIEKLMEEYMRAYLGERYAEDIYSQEGRGPVEGGSPVGNIPQPITEL